MPTVFIVGDLTWGGPEPEDLVKAIAADAQAIGIADPGAAIEWLRESRPDLIVAVGRAADPAAAKLVRRLRRMPHCADVPVIALSPEVQVNGADPAAAGGADRVLPAAVDPATFGRVGRSLLGLGAVADCAGPDGPSAECPALLPGNGSSGESCLIETAMDNMSHGVCVLDSSLRVTAVSRRMADLIPAFAGRELAGADLRDIVRSNGSRASGGSAERANAVEAVVEGAEQERPFRAEHTDDSGRSLEITGQPLPDGGYVITCTDISERRQAEDRLQESERRLKDFAEAASDWLWEMDQDLRFTYISDRLHDATGADPSAALGLTRWQVAGVDPERDPRWRRHRDDLVARRPFRDFRYDLVEGDGRRHFVRASGVPVFDKEGQFRGYRGSASDITAFVEAQARATQAEVRLTDAIEAGSDSFALYDSDDRLVLSNAKYRAVLEAVGVTVLPGMQFEDLLRQGLARGLYADAVGHEDEWLEERLRIRRSGGGSIERQLGDGRWMLIEERRLPDGGTVAMGTDITMQKQAEIALRDSEARFRHFAEAASDWLWETDEDLRFSYFSDRFVQVTGIGPDQVLGKTRAEVGSIDGDEEAWRRHLADLEARRPFRQFRYRYKRADGGRRFLSVSGVPVFDPSGRFLGYRGTGTDVTAEVEAHRRAERAEANLRQAIESVSEGFALYDPDDRLVLCNSKYREIYAESAEAIVPGNTFEEILRYGLERGQYEEAVGREEDWLQDRLGAHRRLSTPIEQKLADGRWLLIEERRMGDGSTVGIRTDITRLKQAEEELRDSQAELSRARDQLVEAIEAMSDGFALYDADDRLVLCNGVYRGIYASSAEAIVPGNTFEDILRHGLARGQYKEAIGREEAWLAQRLNTHRNPRGRIEQKLGDGRWVLIEERPTEEGGIVGIRTDISELKSREGELAGKTELLEAILAGMAQGLVVFDANLTIVTANDRAARLLDVPQSMLAVGEDFGAVIRFTAERGDYGEGTREGHLAKYQAIARSGMPHAFERHLPNGAQLSVRSMPLADGDTVVTYTDITEQKWAEHALRESEAETRAILDTVPDGIVAIDLNGRIHTFNPAAERIFGYAADEVVGANVKKLMPEEVARQHDAYLAAFAGKPQSSFAGKPRELMARRKNGTVFPMSLTINSKPRGDKNIVTGIIRDVTEQRRAEQELRLTKFSIERSRDSAFWIDADGHVLNVNDTACRVFGYSREEFLSLAVWDINPNTTPDEWRSRWDEIKKHGFLTVEATHTTKDGRTFPVEITANYLEYDGREYSCSFARDITDRKAAQEAREKRQELLRRQNEVLGQLAKRLAVAGADTETALREITEAAARTLGVERVGVWNITPEGDRAVCLDLFEHTPARHSSGGELTTFEHARFFTAFETEAGISIEDVANHAWTKSLAAVYFGPNGVSSILAAPVYVASEIAGLFLGEHVGPSRHWGLEDRNFLGALAHLVSLAIETHERREAEERLRLTQFLIDRTSESAYWMGADGRLLYANDAACATLGYSRDEMLSMTIMDIAPDLTPDRWRSNWTRLKESGSLTLEDRHQAKDGRLIPVEVTANFLQFGGRAYVCSFARNVSERKAQEERLRQSEKMQALGQLAGGISHEFNNILTTVAGFTRMAMKHAENAERVRGCLTEVSEASNRAAGLTRQMLTFSHKQVLEPKVLRIGEVLRGMEKLLRAYMEETIELNIDVADGRICAEIDRAQLTQAIINLAINARHAMPDGGRLTIGCQAVEFESVVGTPHGDELAPGRYVRVYVTDTGTGMDRTTLMHIFEPFFTTKQAGKGTGLGLSLVYGMVRNSGGVILVESEVGAGTTFSIYLPVVDKDPVEDAAENHVERSDIGGQETILVAEDDRQLRAFVRTTLEDFGYTVLAAPNGMEAVKLFDEHADRIQLLLTDVIMPEMDGLALVKALSEKRPGLKVIYMTGYAPELTEHLDKLNDDICLIRKPFDPDSLGRLMREVLHG